MVEKAQTNLFGPIWGDYFAGGAGASSGIALAVGEPAYFAVNHSKAALDMYRQNHPHTRLYCEDVFDVDPEKICDGHPVWLLWASPDCTHHSKARGGKPVSKHIRGLPWAIVRAALNVRPGCIMFENVEEIQSWGPCITDENGNEYPDPERKGETFKGFVSIMTTGIEPYHPAHLECCEFLGISPESEDGRRLADAATGIVWHSCDEEPEVGAEIVVIDTLGMADSNVYEGRKMLRHPGVDWDEVILWTNMPKCATLENSRRVRK